MKILRDYPYVPYSNELTDRMVDTRRTMHPWNFVAFTSKAVPEIGPSVRFYGGTAATGITPCAPSMAFDIYGNCEVIIGEGAFQYCTSLQVLEIPEGIAEIEENAFLGCTNLIILCKENSCAHYYAQEHGIRFELQE